MNTKELRTFARSRILPGIERRAASGTLDRKLWKKLADMGILGMAIEKKYGGEGAGVVEFAECLALLAGESLDLGLALSVLDHVMLCAYPLQVFGSEEQKRTYLLSLRKGEAVGAAAVSEPHTGGDPARIRTLAVKEEGAYVLTGQKGPATNAPAADVFLVVAVTDPAAGKNGLTAFIAERNDGLLVEEVNLGFLATSPHGRVIFDHVRIPADRMVGEEGWGHERIARSLFLWERTVVIPAIVAFMERWHHLLISALNPITISPDHRMMLAQKKVELTAYRVLAERLLEFTFGDTEGGRERLELLLFFGKALPSWVDSMRTLVEEARVPLDETGTRMLADLRLLEVGRSFLDWQFQKVLF